MASHDEDTMPEETSGYKLSQPKQSLAQYEQMGRLIAIGARNLIAYVHYEVVDAN